MRKGEREVVGEGHSETGGLPLVPRGEGGLRDTFLEAQDRSMPSPILGEVYRVPTVPVNADLDGAVSPGAGSSLW